MEHLLYHLFDPSHLHPAIVHFPIALLTISVFFDLLSLLLKREDFRVTGYYLLVMGVLSGVAAIGAGLMAAETADAPEDILKLHARLAVGSIILFSILLAWRTKAKNSIPAKLFPVYMAAGLVGAVLILTVGFWGGHMVFEEGAGVKKSLLHRNYKPPVEDAALPEPAFATEESTAKSGGKKHDPDHSGHSH